MKHKQFEVWIADLNPTIGTEPGKVRPVVIVQTDFLNTLHPSSIICPVTTNTNPESEILRVHLPKNTCGLEVSSDVIIDQVRAIDNRRLVRKAGSLTPFQARKVKSSLKAVLDLD